MIEEELEMYDTFLRENKQARSEWYIERRDKTTLLTSHMEDSIEDAKREIYTAIRNKTKDDFKEIVSRLEDCLKDESGHKRIKENSDYILENWTAAGLRLKHKEGIKGCSAESHVSHILSSRMSSRPMGGV